MAVSISRTWGADTGTFYPVQVDGYQTTRQTLNVVHEILGGGTATSMRGAALRSGSLRLIFTDETTAAAALTELAKLGTFELSNDDRASIDMTFVVSGDSSLELEDSTREAWILTVQYREVLP